MADLKGSGEALFIAFIALKYLLVTQFPIKNGRQWQLLEDVAYET